VTAEDLRSSVFEGKIKLSVGPEASIWAMGHAVPQIAEIYITMKWRVLMARQHFFVTSDCPVHRQYNRPTEGAAGLFDRDVEIRFPLSADRMLVLTHDLRKLERLEGLLNNNRRREAEALRRRTPSITYEFVDGETVTSMNDLTIKRAQRWVYSPAED